MKEQTKQLTEKSTQDVVLVRQGYSEVVGEVARLIGYMVPFVPPARRGSILDSTTLAPELKDKLQALVRDAPYAYEPFLAGGFGGAVYSTIQGRVTISEPILPLNEPQEGTPSPN